MEANNNQAHVCLLPKDSGERVERPDWRVERPDWRGERPDWRGESVSDMWLSSRVRLLHSADVWLIILRHYWDLEVHKLSIIGLWFTLVFMHCRYKLYCVTVSIGTEPLRYVNNVKHFEVYNS